MIVKSFKTSDAEFIAEVVNGSGHILEIQNPLCLIPTEQGVMPIPYIMTGKGPFKINTSLLLFEPFDPIENVVNMYKERFGGIVTSSPKLVL
jgi:hypothetical protein